MIAYLEGKVLSKEANAVIVAAGGIGYRVFVPPSSLFVIEEEASVALHTHQYVRETALELYGFERPEELTTFETLIGVSGIGPKSALGILSITTPEQLRAAVASGNVSVLTKVSGIGRKTAERLLVELKDTFAAADKRAAEQQTLVEGDVQVIEALEGLGYSVSDARKVLESIPADIETTEDRLKAALKNIGTKK